MPKVNRSEKPKYQKRIIGGIYKVETYSKSKGFSKTRNEITIVTAFRAVVTKKRVKKRSPHKIRVI